MDKIKKAEQREQGLILLASGILTIAGLLLLGLFLNKSILIVILGIGITILGIKMIYDHARVLMQGNFPITTMLLKNPRKIVWVYSVVTQRMPFGFQITQSGMMYFKLIDGDELTLSLPASELKSVSEILNYHLPHATFGYTKEREQWYIAHPEMLMKSDQ